MEQISPEFVPVKAGKSKVAHGSPIVELKNVSKSYDDHMVLKNMNLTIYNGEFLTLLGPSGCGKTTTLRMIAGFETPDSGEIIINGTNVASLPPHKRTVNTVFQSYALFPHMSVFDNIAFGLKMSKTPKNEIKDRVMEALKTVKLADFASRRPAQLSGGQQQRVAVARAIVNKPSVLLLDEPLSALDAKLRFDMQEELKLLQQKLKITFVLVTHDQEEALSISDRVVVMNDGVIQQVGTPRSVYEEPANLFTAQFVGDINIFDAQVVDIEDGNVIADVEGYRCAIDNKRPMSVGETFKLLLRPEDMRVEKLSESPDTIGLLVGNVLIKTYKGATLDSTIVLENGKQVLASEYFDEEDEDFDYQVNEKVSIGWVKGWEVILANEND
ncbi:MAG: spermidine/putrescine ABC transporter ATP-binding protein PotA [Deferribacteraceae bacterium]|jgi:spermidine/putrescine transport system ATP-binding protein|nr:spermidine/putrescine ABC transporter ATP-binding protein PotA [Deferribacteraceae bacterium]